MPWFSASRRVYDRQRGVEWEIYVTRGVKARWRTSYTDMPPWFGQTGVPVDAAVGESLVDVVMAAVTVAAIFVLDSLIAPMLRLLGAAAASKSRPHGVLTVEASPSKLSLHGHGWIIPRALRQPLLDEICAGLEAGTVPQPAAATYLGIFDDE